jgi:hypothetical protein
VKQHNRGSLEFVTSNTGGPFDALGNVSDDDDDDDNNNNNIWYGIAQSV